MLKHSLDTIFDWMNKITKRQLAEIVIHILFWIGVFYTLNVLTRTVVKVRVSHNGMVVEQDEIRTLLPAVFITLALLGVLFYGNIFWLFKKILSFRSNITRFAVVACWFLLIFAVDDVVIGLFADQSSPVRSAVFRKEIKGDIVKSVGPPPVQHIMPDRVERFPDKANFRFAIDDIFNRPQLNLINLLLVFLSIMGVSIAYFFLKEWAKADVVRTQLQANQLSTEIKFLRSQVNPHFLFNTLNNLFSMAQNKGDDEVAEGISKLSGMMRYMLYDSNTEQVPLKNEIAYIENCIMLNKLRYADDEARVNFIFPKNTDGLMIAPMLFITFVENAFKHGVAIGQVSDIDINLAASKEEIVFSCTNAVHVQHKKMDEGKSGIGLENVKRRLELLYPGKHRLTIKNDDEKYSVELRIETK